MPPRTRSCTSASGWPRIAVQGCGASIRTAPRSSSHGSGPWREICRIDHRRRRLGRPRLFEAVMRLPALHHHVFRLRYRYKLTLDQTFESLRPRFPGLTLAAVAAADTRIGATLSGRQTRALIHVQPRFEPLDRTDSGAREEFTPADTGPNPEDVALVREQRHRLRSAIADLAPDDRLMVALRFEEGLALVAVARMAGLRDAQQADRRLRRILERLRSALG